MKLQDDICGMLREDILSCRIPPGTELREQALAARLGVSKSPVREALLRLAAERLVSIRPRQGYQVTPVSMASAADLLQFRAVLEIAAVRGAAKTATVAQRGALLAAARFEGGADGFIAYNRRFHAAIAACCGNVHLARAATDTIAQADRLVCLSLHALQGRNPQRLVAEHAELADAIAAGDGRAAVRQMRQHLGAAERRILEALKRLGSTTAASGGTPDGGNTCLHQAPA